jgi:hypothetical protein
MYFAIYFCVTTLLGNALANAVGGWLLDFPLLAVEGLKLSLFGMSLNRYNFLFLISFALRVISAYIVLPRLIKPSEANQAD